MPHESTASSQWTAFLIRIIFPTALTIALFSLTFFAVIIPTIERISMDRKKEMIRELTNSAWNILAKLHSDEQQGILTREQAQQLAMEQIRNLQYGQEMKDYFWVNDMHPRMIIHPYRLDLTGQDLRAYEDPNGIRIFVRFVEIVRERGSGYAQYTWQWKDQKDRIEPKISYVKGFAPWGWIIGTGIYVDDVQREIKSLTHDLIIIILAILLIISLLLGSMIRQSYRTLKLRQKADRELRESEEKYRTLVESAGEGMLMALEGRYMYANQTIATLLGYGQNDFNDMPVAEIFPDEPTPPGAQHIRELLSGRSVPASFETRLRSRSGDLRDVILAASRISIGNRSGFIAVITDITKRKQDELAFGERSAASKAIIENLNVGLFRRTVGRRSQWIEVNPAMLRLFGFADREEFLTQPFGELYWSAEDRKRCEAYFQATGMKQEIVRLKRRDESVFTACVRGVTRQDEKTDALYFDGLVEDVTEVQTLQDKRVKLLSEMQAALIFFNQPLAAINVRELNLCPANASVARALILMEERGANMVVIQDARKDNVGVLTDRDIKKCARLGRDPARCPVTDIMSTPIISLPAQSHVFEAWQLMMHHNISHLLVTDHEGRLSGWITSNDIASIQKYSPAVLLLEIQSSTTPEEVIARNAALPHLITILVRSGAKPQNINSLTTIVIDTVLQKLIEFAVSDLGSPPASFAFIVFGSEGRREQTLKTDQDNAVIYADVPPESEQRVHGYFLELGRKVCRWLDQAGYPYCEGGNMAQNPTWCQPLTIWKRHFSQWVHTGSAEDLLKAKIFFDFRCGYGDRGLADELRGHLNATTAKNPRFFQMLARNVLPLSLPIGLFGNFVVESVGDKQKAFDIKLCMMPIVDFARIYSLQHQIDETNTLERLNRLHQLNILSRQNHLEITQAFSYLMQIRLQCQAQDIESGKRVPDNYVSPHSLTSIEQRLLKEIFTQIKHFQAKLSYTFTGQAGGV
jgi:PAS domain S-box-containing protein